ncbi:hypothetical protein PFISCL1PPCAC_24262, partial [Pristionchus fissidentatus]
LPYLTLLLPVSYGIDCYDHTNKFSIQCEELVWFEECYALYNKSIDGSWKVEDAGCSGKVMKKHLSKIMGEDGNRIKMSSDHKVLFQFIPDGLTLVSCLDPFCNLPERIVERLEKELKEEEEVTTTEKPVEKSTKSINEDLIDRLLNGKIERRKPFEFNNELGVKVHREIRPMIFSAPDRG